MIIGNIYRGLGKYHGDSELKILYGKQRHFVYAELERRIKEALLWDDRITSVNDFSFRNERDCVFVKFTVDSVFGSTELESVVN